MQTNRPATSIHGVTHEGGPAGRQIPIQELTRAVSTCLLWEDTFYEKGSALAARMAELCQQVTMAELSQLAITARGPLRLRHVPLWLAVQMARRNSAEKAKNRLVADTLVEIIRRPDEITEFLALYWKDKKQPMSAQVKRGLARALGKFSRFQLAKWNQKTAIKLRDVLFLTHAKPKDAEQEALWKELVEGTLAAPDTWEVALSSGADKKATWERLLREGGLGYMALLMNLRNMTEAGVDPPLVEQALRDGASTSMAFPYRFITAAQHAPQFAQALSDALCSSITTRVPGSTVVLVDVSGSMDGPVAGKSQALRWMAAASLAVVFREMAPACRVFTFSSQLVEVQNWRGLHLVDAIGKSQAHHSTQLQQAQAVLKGLIPNPDRLIVITDEQTHDGILAAWAPQAYLINVASYQPGLDVTQGWKRISGWSERIVEWMISEEVPLPASAENA